MTVSLRKNHLLFLRRVCKALCSYHKDDDVDLKTVIACYSMDSIGTNQDAFLNEVYACLDAQFKKAFVRGK